MHLENNTHKYIIDMFGPTNHYISGVAKTFFIISHFNSRQEQVGKPSLI